jgi:hypothetical protein
MNVRLAALVLALLAATVPIHAHSAPRSAASRIDPRLLPSIAALPAGDRLAVWVVFTDKGVHEVHKPAPPRDLVAPRSLERRRKVRAENTLLDAADLPLDEAYVAAVTATGARLRQRSRWLNRLSVEATAAQIRAVAALPCVQEVEPLVRFRRRAGSNLPPELDAPAEVDRTPRASTSGTIDYGPSFDQLQQIGITTLHGEGLTGQNVLIGHFDNGYRLLGHESLAAMSIVAAHDFVDGDADPAPPAGAPANWGAHGIVTLSVLAGYTPGELIGAAYGSSYVLARTEDDGSETPLEEDNWVAAIEWADSLGIDVASTSLGYLTYDSPYPSWTWENMDGESTAITRAADLAVARGIVVVNAAGNEGFDANHNTLLAPADGDSVIAVGAADSVGVRVSFSSVGPTTDVPARIKPDIAARGVLVRCARSTSTTAYGRSSGTSLACPLAAGVAALLVGASPTATPMQIRDAMRLTAHHAGSPDNLLGWGVVDAVAALTYLNASDVADARLPVLVRRLVVFPNPFNPMTTIHYALAGRADVALTIADARGRLVRTLRRGADTSGEHTWVWDGRDATGRMLPSGVYFLRLDAAAAGGPQATLHTKAILVR